MNFLQEWQNQKYPETITISRSYFRHLLYCLNKQKEINKLMKLEYEENQKMIDRAWSSGIFLLGLDDCKKISHRKIIEKYCEIWNAQIDFIQKYIEEDMIEFPNDENIYFKWKHLVSQEIEMWIKLCCYSESLIDCENEKYQHGLVKKEDFDFICERRGFTPKMKTFLADILKQIEIGEDL